LQQFTSAERVGTVVAKVDPQGERLLASRPDVEEQRPHPRRATVTIEIRLRSTRTSIKRQTV
jgi:hypothetical protein